ncbi:MAG: Zn-dependent alcohol dehydrogenase [Actinobacteria bacterium HGW-Actinobacteria-4]|nr:MAG: Zn-dependent alcohol dehydrogenase [Actinobacteria bacterium HGW-Actinobacteria-4]
MIAAHYKPGHGVSVVEAEAVPPGPGHVQIAVAYNGICGTDLHIAHGAMDERVGEGSVIGHEMSGRVVAGGEGTEEWPPGTPVTVMPLLWCGKCPTCLAGNRHICDTLTFVGIDSPGALQQLWTVPQEILIELPHSLSLRAAALVEPVAVAHHDVVRGRVQAGEHVVVVGGGPVGVLIAIVATYRGAHVTVVEVDAFRRGVIDKLGLTSIDPIAQDVVAVVEASTGGAGADVSFEVSGSQPGLTTSLAVLRPRGRLVAVGIHPQPREMDLKRVFWRELEILGARVYERSDYDGAIDLIATEVIPVDALISEVVPLTEAPAAFEALARGGSVMKVLVDCGQEEAS